MTNALTSLRYGLTICKLRKVTTYHITHIQGPEDRRGLVFGGCSQHHLPQETIVLVLFQNRSILYSPFFRLMENEEADHVSLTWLGCDIMKDTVL